MKAFHVFLILILSGLSAVFGQKRPPVSKGIDLGSGFKSTGWSPSMLYHQDLSVRRLPFIKFSAGLKGWGYYSGKTNLSSQNNGTQRDILEFRNVSHTGLSAVVGLTVSIWKLDLGVNTDLLGFTLGSERNGFYPKNLAPAGRGEAFYNKWVPASPNVFNMLPVVLKDNNGQSELFARIWVSRRVGLKVGYTYGQMSYATGKIKGDRVILDNGHKRFSDTYGIPYAALCFYIDE